MFTPVCGPRPELEIHLRQFLMFRAASINEQELKIDLRVRVDLVGDVGVLQEQCRATMGARRAEGTGYRGRRVKRREKRAGNGRETSVLSVRGLQMR
jgi:hypothetical protein